MQLTFLGKDTQGGNSPTLWETDDDQYVIQGLPQEDFWLLDDDVLILSVFSADGRTGGFALPSSPDLLKRCIAVRDHVWRRAIPYAEYTA